MSIGDLNLEKLKCCQFKNSIAMMLTSGLLRVTDEHKYQRCGVVVMLVDLCYDNCAASTLTCFRGFLHYDMTRSVLSVFSISSVSFNPAPLIQNQSNL